MRWAPVIFSFLIATLLSGTYRSSNSLVHAAFSPVDLHRLACGSPRNITAQGQLFLPDSDQSSHSLRTSADATVSAANSSLPSPIYQSLRLFSQPAYYDFIIRQPGRHWIRLHFFPLPHPAHDLASVPITVAANDFVLMNNFTLRSSNRTYLSKEFSVNLTSDKLTLAFIPLNGTVSFVNGIEVVSAPDGLISDQALAIPNAPFTGLTSLALETMYRLNLGGPLVTPLNDTLGRTWEGTGSKYLHVNSSAVKVIRDPETVVYPPGLTEEIAPRWVYCTADVMGDANVTDMNFNMTWVFQVDPSFSYLIRLHFCDIFSKTLNTLVFNVYVNTDIAIPSLDLSSLKGGLNVPYYKDFVSNSSAGTTTMTVSVGPDTQAEEINALINGIEIMKVSNGFNSLDGNSSVSDLVPSHYSRNRTGFVIGMAVGSVILAMLLAVACYCCFLAPRTKAASPPRHQFWLPLPLYGNSHTITKVSTVSQKSGTGTLTSISLASTNLARVFTFQEIMDSTNRFDESLLLGVGGFGKVYKGTLEDGTVVAVKRGNPRSEQGLAEFQTEIEMLSKLRHRHLVSLIGYCDERSEMILVYEYMANGPLRSHLYGTNLPPLSWKRRLEICIGAARGLHYLHTGASQSIIHRDVKTTNILLDENFVAKVADFGLSKTGPSLDQTHVSTAVKGSFGYLDPEYFRRQQLTEKSDVYSFGVVLMEVLCTRPALNPGLPREQVNIAEWAMTWQKKGMLSHIMDPALTGKVSSASLKKYGDTAEKCLAEHGVDRPSMGDVLWNLEYALQLEESSALADVDENSTNHIAGIPMVPLQTLDNSVGVVEGRRSGTDDDVEDGTTNAVFSQLVNPRGR